MLCSFIFQLSIPPGHRTATLENDNSATSQSELLSTPSVEILKAQKTLSDFPVINPWFSLCIFKPLLSAHCHIYFFNKCWLHGWQKRVSFRLHLYLSVFVSDSPSIFHYLSPFVRKIWWMAQNKEYCLKALIGISLLIWESTYKKHIISTIKFATRFSRRGVSQNNQDFFD